MMGVKEGLIFFLLFVPVAIFILTVQTLALIGKTLGARRKYVGFLLWIFEYGRKKIERHNKIKEEEKEEYEDEDSSEEEEEEKEEEEVEVIKPIRMRRRISAECKRAMGGGEPAEEEMVGLGRLMLENKVVEVVGEEEMEEDVKDTEFEFSDIFEFVQTGIEAIVQDQVTQRFASEELKSWNLLTRTNRVHEFISWRLSLMWMIGFGFRYCFLLPVRVTICTLGVIFLTMSTALVGCIPEPYVHLKRGLYKLVYLRTFEFLSWSLSAVIRHHDLQNRPGVATKTLDGRPVPLGGGICVANHTSPIDVLVLAVDQCYDMVGQRHGGFLGIMQRALARASSHIWFERSEMKDREAVAKRLREHVEDTRKLPILIFPEGTCINNSAVMQFKKGSFEVGGVIYPAAIKYDARFGDPFWDSSNYGMIQYLLMMMSSWAIVCDVWYLPPMYMKGGESPVDFAKRVKSAIARKGGLVDLDWDGQLKRAFAKKEWREQQQLEYSKKFVNSSSPKKGQSQPIPPPPRPDQEEEGEGDNNKNSPSPLSPPNSKGIIINNESQSQSEPSSSSSSSNNSNPSSSRNNVHPPKIEIPVPPSSNSLNVC